MYGEGKPKEVLSENFRPIIAEVVRPELGRFGVEECLECDQAKGHSNSCVKSE